MSRVNEICADATRDIDGAMVAAVVDLNTGMIIGVHNTDSGFSQDYVDSVAAAAVEMFRGKNIARVEEMLRRSKSDDARNLVEEIQMSTDRTYHFMTVIREKPDYLFILITGINTNLGLGWSGIRSVVPRLVPVLPGQVSQ